MTDGRKTHSSRRASTARGVVAGAALGLTALGTMAVGCIERPIEAVLPNTQSAVTIQVANNAVSKVDLLLEVDNSRSMAGNQANIAAQLQPLIERLTNPPDRNGDGTPDYPAVRDLHVAVISSDLGAGGQTYCAERGDDGRLNPLRNGPGLSRNPPTNLPAECGAANSQPDFLAFDSQSTSVADFSRQFRCSALLGITGCGIEQQLESAYRALVVHGANRPAGSPDPNAGFLREDALLAIVLLTDEEDGSTRDDAVDVFNTASTNWADPTYVNMRFYMYQPGGAQDPTHPLERYIDPRNRAAGFLALKPNHPERVIFAAITSVPQALPTVPGEDGLMRTNWDALLGAPDPNDRDNFFGRDTTTALAGTTPEGAFNLTPTRQTGPGSDAQYPVAACARREGDQIYRAYPARRIVEVARRFDEAPLCDGRPCRNGLVTSVCSTDYTAAVNQIVERIASRLPTPCLPRVLQQRTNQATGERTVECVVRETLPPGVACDTSAGRTSVLDTNGAPRIDRDADGTMHAVCDVQQIATDASNRPVSLDRPGWYYEPITTDATCRQRISFTPRGEPQVGAVLRLECIQSVVRGGSAPTGGA